MSAVATRTLLSVRDLHVHLGQSHVLQGVSFDVPEGGVTALLGRNGVGKTTTLRAILGLVGRRGSVQLDGDELTSLPTHRVVHTGDAQELLGQPDLVRRLLSVGSHA